jgi:hypothetical protein
MPGDFFRHRGVDDLLRPGQHLAAEFENDPFVNGLCGDTTASQTIGHIKNLDYGGLARLST